jgi:hypothetical protein
VRKTVVLFLCLAVLVGILPAVEFIANGNFEQALDQGWTDTVVGTSGFGMFERTDTMGCGSGCAARVYKTLASYAGLGQTVTIPNVNLTFSFDGRFRLAGGSSTCWPAAALFLRYQDASGNDLATTKFVLHNEFCSWGNNDTAHIVEIENPEVWNHHTLDIAQEISSNLPGLNAADVVQIQVQIYAYDNGT